MVFQFCHGFVLTQMNLVCSFRDSLRKSWLLNFTQVYSICYVLYDIYITSFTWLEVLFSMSCSPEKWPTYTIKTFTVKKLHKQMKCIIKRLFTPKDSTIQRSLRNIFSIPDLGNAKQKTLSTVSLVYNYIIILNYLSWAPFTLPHGSLPDMVRCGTGLRPPLLPLLRAIRCIWRITVVAW